jgi:hypothetical protein
MNKQEILELIGALNIRAEYIFDKIQQNPGNTSMDETLTGYLEMLCTLIEMAEES